MKIHYTITKNILTFGIFTGPFPQEIWFFVDVEQGQRAPIHKE